MIRIFFGLSLFLIPLVSFSQRCGTVEYEKLLLKRNTRKETIEQFELWIQNKIAQRAKLGLSNRTASVSYEVPIVVHVINNGEAVGTGTNLSDAQILSQIPVLNNDYQRLNADSTKTPSGFTSVAGKFPITFVMAKQDPNGLATNGIVRVKGTQTSWDISDNYALKALSYWPAEDYLNIWVTNLTGVLIGYTQLPVSSMLQGLETASDDRLTDGVVIDYQAYGTADASGGSSFNLLGEYNKGRTATHEIGHFFGLRHVWGDCLPKSCGCTDYVADTPPQDRDYNGQCPSGNVTDCSGNAMYSNYMNYTDDACMNIFSQGQVSRMDVIINNSPRRLSLITSPGLYLPSPVPNDAGIANIITPGMAACDGSITPSFVLQNYGSNQITSVQVQLLLNGSATQTQTFALNLSPDTNVTLSFSPVSITAGSLYSFLYQVTQTNGGTDGRAINDTLSVSTTVPSVTTLPLIENFDTAPSDWRIYNPDGLYTWAWDNSSNQNTNGAMYIDFYDYENIGASDYLITPVIDLTNDTIASISFDYAYAKLIEGSNDRLKVLVTTECNFNLSSTEIFNKSGSALATVTTDAPFTPTSAQWVNSGVISLNQFLGQRIQIAFVAVNDNGNNLFLDNVIILNSSFTAFKLNGIVTPSPVSCQPVASPVIQIQNEGNKVINSFVVDTYLGGQLSMQSFTNVQLGISATQNFSLNQVQLNSGANSVSVVIRSPNGVTSSVMSKDSISRKLYISDASDYIPLAQNFNSGVGSWTTTNPSFGSIWYPALTNDSISMEFDAFDNLTIGDRAWLVSPVLDFSSATKASLVFESSYAYNFLVSENLQVLSSTDCGVSFNQVLFTSSGFDLATNNSSSSWLPSANGDWKKNFINLDTLAGKANVRIAFVATNANGNNLYLDNIRFFVGDSEASDTLTVNNLYAVYGGISGVPVKITFNLPDRQDVRIQVYGVTGNVVSDDTFPNTLNQTYTLMESTKDAPGLFIVRIQTQSPSSARSTKVLFGF